MAKYVGKKSEARWNNAAKFAEANSAGNRFVHGIYREPRGQSTSGASANIIVARVQQPVTEIDDVFDATVAAVILGTGPAVDTEIEVDNLDSGLIDEAHVGNITGAYRATGTTGEEVFILLKGMTIYCFQGNDGRWKVFQSGGAFSTP